MTRKQIRLSLSADLLRAFNDSKRAAEEASGLTLTDAEYLLALLRNEMQRRQAS